MPTIYIDKKPYQVKEGENLLHACLSLGFDLPYFCWHPALGSVGACRQCAVKQFKDENDEHGRLVMACMTPAQDDTYLSIEDAEARDFRASVIEWLMVNHPHDCPVCDEGGECHLQDMTVMTGHNYREFRFDKRTYRNQDLGPFINHEMNRCIQCYRCVRFYREHAGGRDFDVFAAHDHVYFGRYEDGPLESEFSGNLVEVCPTGVFTDKTLKQHYTRKWDLQTAPSVCVNCSLGCNTIPGERYGRLRRIRNRYHHDVNGYFLCDRGRYGYEFVNSDRRIRRPWLRRPDQEQARPVSGESAIQQAASFLADRDRVIGIGSPRASLEANFALRQLVGPDRFCNGLAEQESQLVSTILAILQAGPARVPSLREAAQADAVLVLGEDVTNTAPLLALALRQAVRQQPMETARNLNIPAWNDAAVREAIQAEKGPFFTATPYPTKLDDIATRAYHAAPADLARLGLAVAHALSPEAPAVTDLPADLEALAQEIAAALKEADRPLIVSGAGCGSEAVLQAAANVAWALSETDHPADLCFTLPEANSLGVGLLGGADLSAAFEAIEAGQVDTVIILENDLYRRIDSGAVEAALSRAKQVIVLDYLATETTARADLILPSGAFAETDGTLVNNEGRAQRFYQVFVPEGDIQAGWRWLQEIGAAADGANSLAWATPDGILAALAETMPLFGPVVDIAPPADFRLVGQQIPRQPPRYSGRTAMHADVDVSEPKPPQDPDTPLAFSMEGYEGQPPAPLIPRFWAPGWNSVQALNKFQSEIAGPLRGGEPGRRLLEASQVDKPAYFANIPAAFAPGAGEWLVVPIYHIFGSEELSVLTPGVAQRAPQPYLALKPEAMTGLGVSEGDVITVTLAEQSVKLPVKSMPALPDGVAGLPVGLPGDERIILPKQTDNLVIRLKVESETVA